MGKKRKPTLKRKKEKKPIIKVDKVISKPIKPAKRKYHKIRKYVRKQPIEKAIVEQPIIEPIIDKQLPIQFDIIPRNIIYGAVAIIVIIAVAIPVIILNIPPEPVRIRTDGSYLSMQVKQ